MANLDAARHTGHVAVVTGAGSGIGRATALRLAREGAAVVASDVNAEGLAGTLAEICASGKDAITVAGNVAKQEDVDRLVATTLERHGHIDVLANVAGIMDWFLPAHEVDDETWSHVLDVNLNGAMRLCRRVLPGMMERHSGAIVNIASVGGFRGGAAGVAYTVSKHGLIGLTRSIAWTYRTEGIRCNAIAPGAVATNIGATAAPRSQWGLERLAKIHALAERTAEPDEIAALLSWLVSDEASNVNGVIVPADNGWTAG
jgi:NAD(P)-dependent dehydrogenase (short-subunit alcohol dehydrogenase family)